MHKQAATSTSAADAVTFFVTFALTCVGLLNALPSLSDRWWCPPALLLASGLTGWAAALCAFRITPDWQWDGCSAVQEVCSCIQQGCFSVLG